MDVEQKQLTLRTFNELSLAASHCRSCSLSLTRSKVVFGVGNPNSPLMLIGEGPGAREDAIGEPFVGPAGKLLDECLLEAGMKRKHIYITNIVKCRAAEVLNGHSRNRVPTPTEVETCVPLWLERQIREMKPLVIVCIGGPAASAIFGREVRITKERGTISTSVYSPRTIAALHPAFILRQEGGDYHRTRQLLVQDLLLAKERAIAARAEPKMNLF
jgi:uracil-DNA glycosylase